MRQPQSTVVRRIFRGDTLAEKHEGAPVVGAAGATARLDNLYRGKDLNRSILYCGKGWNPSQTSTCGRAMDAA